MRRLNNLITLVVVALMFLLFFVSLASAQSLKKRDLITVALQTGDIVTTNMVIKRGGYEANPLMKPFASSPVRLSTAKAVYTSYQIFASHRTARNHPKLAKMVWLGANLMQGYVVYHNVKELRK